jgi:hypothetical protein
MVTGAPELLREAIVKLAAGERPAPIDLPALATAPPTPDRIRRLEGTYLLENGTRLRVWARGTQLFSNDWPLLPTADGGFFSPRDYGRIRPVEGADGRIARLDWNQKGQVYPAPRVSDAP